ncbi:hypothetical protein [Gallaecimonas sp. GXIMD4217]|uniref:hypothetical protein n=1 Tax=Gallaecimonas sp. GXIMD4217 TaxID=3131927 RepID=UPI00311B09C4
METAEQRVHAFIQDYQQWQQGAQRLDDLDRIARLRAVKAAYQALLEKHCLPGTQGQGISFGPEPSHHVELERITNSRSDGDSALVTTSLSLPGGQVLHYEYHLRPHDGSWRIKSLLFVDDDGKCESL